jgi:hypothetical protein
MAYVSFKQNRKGGLDVRTLEGLRGRIVRKRSGRYEAVLTRPLLLCELNSVVDHLARLNSAKQSL